MVRLQEKRISPKGEIVQAKRAKMATPMAPTIAESAMSLLADETVVDVPDGLGAEAVLEVPPPVLVVGGLVVVVRVVAPTLVVVTPVAVVVVVGVVPEPVLVDPPALLVRQLESVEEPTVKAAVCETLPVESRKVRPREVPEG